jgi:hypothetical protein
MCVPSGENTGRVSLVPDGPVCVGQCAVTVGLPDVGLLKYQRLCPPFRVESKIMVDPSGRQSGLSSAGVPVEVTAGVAVVDRLTSVKPGSDGHGVPAVRSTRW